MAKTATQATFQDILDTPVEEVERPKPLPVGTYDAIVKGLPEYGESTLKKTPFVRFTLAITATGDDVDEAEIEEMGGIADKIIKSTYYLTNDALFRLTDFLTHCGIEDMSSKTVRQAIDETPNCPVRVRIGHRPSEDGQQIFPEVKATMRAE